MSDQVYFIKPVGMDGPIKIGFSAVPMARLLSMVAWAPFDLELIGSVPGTYSDEQYLHRCFWNHHRHHEWFNQSEELTSAIADILEAGVVRRDLIGPPQIDRKPVSRNYTDEYRFKKSYLHKIWHATNRVRKNADPEVLRGGYFSAPDDVEQIIARWGGWRCQQREPSEAELARLDEYISDPVSHVVFVKSTRKAA